ncbi:thiamine phosphate synthase, partial [Pyxidicoccus fallax]
AAGADYVGVGPLFGTTTKQVPAPVLGLEAFAAVVRDSPLPVVGIGGVGLDNIARVAATGAHGAAVVSDALLAEDIAERVRRLVAAFEQGRAGH